MHRLNREVKYLLRLPKRDHIGYYAEGTARLLTVYPPVSSGLRFRLPRLAPAPCYP